MRHCALLCLSFLFLVCAFPFNVPVLGSAGAISCVKPFGQVLGRPVGTTQVVVQCSSDIGGISPLYQGHYEVDPTRTQIGLGDPVATNLLRAVDFRFWRVSIGRWEFSDYPNETEIERREYFTGECTLAAARDPANYRWDHMDDVFTAVAAFPGCVPLICIDYMPATLSNGTEVQPAPSYTFPNGVRNAPPKNNTIFAEVIKHVVMHYTQGWPNGIGHYYPFEFWEVWNEPEAQGSRGFWNGDWDQMYALYEAVAPVIKAIDTSANPLQFKVGGLSFALGHLFVQPFLDYCVAHALPLDYLSWHRYDDNPSVHLTSAGEIHTMLHDAGYPAALSILAEWGISLNDPAPFYNSSYFAAFTALMLCCLEDAPIRYQTHTCLKDRDNVTDRGGYWGILSRDPTKAKPVYHVFRAFQQLVTLTPIRLALQLGALQASAPNQSALAGRGIDVSQISVVFANYDAQEAAVILRLEQLPAPLYSWWRLDHYLLDNISALALVDSQMLRGSSLRSQYTAAARTVHLFVAMLVSAQVIPFEAVALGAVAAAAVVVILMVAWRRCRQGESPSPSRQR